MSSTIYFKSKTVTNAVTAAIVKQFEACAPHIVVHANRPYSQGSVAHVVDNGRSQVVFSYMAPRKRRGAFVADKVAVTVAYAPGDVYDIQAVLCDGATFGTTPVFAVKGVTFDFLAELGDWIAGA